MKIDITAIKFNHTSGTITTRALMIRKNLTQNITPPEWTPANNDGIKAKAAYSIADTTGNTITVEAKFTCDTPGAKVFIRTTGGQSFGNVSVTEVTLDNNYLSFPLTGTDLATGGIDILKNEWTWQYKVGDGGAWENIGVTRFMVYTTLSRPRAPWSYDTNFSDDQLPWTDVLDVTNVWAKNATSEADVKKAITERMYGLGATTPRHLTYDGRSVYSNLVYFKCTEFLSWLNGNIALGNVVNCSDCATIVSSFTNILGCALWQGEMGYNFALRDLLAIGSTTWALPFSNGRFSYHEVAWEAPCDINDNLFDACLQVNTNTGTGAPVGQLPVAMPFGLCNADSYRAYLTKSGPTGCDKCIPYPDEKLHRRIS